MAILRYLKFRPLGLSLITLSLGLAACQPKPGTDLEPSLAALDSESALLTPLPDVQPMVSGPAAPLRRAPAAAALPKVRTLGYANAPVNDRYAWIDRANRINDTIGDAPPDYGFDYQNGVQPYGWESADGYRTYAEPTDGGYRYYYYDPGANEPYFVRDPSYSYGYSSGRIVSVYDRGGRALDSYQAQQQADYASRYYDRGRAMRAAADSRQRRGVFASGWADQRSVINTQRAEWNRAQSNNADWRAYRKGHDGQDQRLEEERAVRAQAARQFATWQAQGLRGQPPTLYDQQQDGRGDGGGIELRQAARLRQQRQLQNQQFAREQKAQQDVRQRATTLRQREAALRQQRDVLARQQGAAQQAKALQRRDASIRAKAAQVRQQQAVRVRAQQQRVEAQTELLRAAQKRQVVAKQRAAQQRATVQHQREADKTQRIAVTRQNAAAAGQVRADAQQQVAALRQQSKAAARAAAAAARQNAPRPVAPIAPPKPQQPQKPGTAAPKAPLP